MIAATYKKRLWAWDFETRETVQIGDTVMLDLFGQNMVIAKPPADHRYINLLLRNNPPLKQENL